MINDDIENQQQPDINDGMTWDRSNIPVGSIGLPTITTTIPPKPTPIHESITHDEYHIIENDDDDGKSSKGDAASVDTNITTTIINKPSEVETDLSRRPSTESRSATPTIWETYKILGNQYTRFSSDKSKFLYKIE